MNKLYKIDLDKAFGNFNKENDVEVLTKIVYSASFVPLILEKLGLIFTEDEVEKYNIRDIARESEQGITIKDGRGNIVAEIDGNSIRIKGNIDNGDNKTTRVINGEYELSKACDKAHNDSEKLLSYLYNKVNDIEKELAELKKKHTFFQG